MSLILLFFAVVNHLRHGDPLFTVAFVITFGLCYIGDSIGALHKKTMDCKIQMMDAIIKHLKEREEKKHEKVFERDC